MKLVTQPRLFFFLALLSVVVFFRTTWALRIERSKREDPPSEEEGSSAIPDISKIDCDGYLKDECEVSDRSGVCVFNVIEEECQKMSEYVPKPKEPSRAECAALAGMGMGKCNSLPGCEFDGVTGDCYKKPSACSQVKCALGLTCPAHFKKVTPDGACCPICLPGESFYNLPHPIIQKHIAHDKFRKGGTYRTGGIKKGDLEEEKEKEEEEAGFGGQGGTGDDLVKLKGPPITATSEEE